MTTTNEDQQATVALPAATPTTGPDITAPTSEAGAQTTGPQAPAAPATDGDREVTDYERRLRRENEARRKENDALKAEFTALKDGIAKAFGITDVQDPAAKAAELATERDTIANERAALAREVKVLRIAAAEGIDGDALLDSRRFHDRLAAIDSTADDYDDQVTALVKAHAPTAPEPTPPASSGGHIPTGTPAITSPEAWRDVLFPKKD